MSRKTKRFAPLEAVEIVDISAEGKAVGRHENMVVFVENLVPGDVANVQPYRKKKSFYEARPTEILKLSAHRIDAFCEHFGICGGCKWQNFDYQKQLEFKQKQVSMNFAKIGDLEVGEVLPILPAPKGSYYRNKLEYTFSNNRWITDDEAIEGEEILNRNGLGFHIPKRFDKIIDVKNCYLQPAPSNEIRLAIKALAEALGVPFFDLRKQTGCLRNLILRNNSKSEFMILLSLFERNDNFISAVAEMLQKQFPQVVTFGFFHNPKGNDTLYDIPYENLFGSGFLNEYFEKCIYKIGPKSFFQTNTEQSEKLYSIAKNFADLKGNELLYDLYCGLGSIGIFMADSCKEVVGIESVPEAVELGNENAKMNGFTHLKFYSGDMKDLLSPDFVSKKGLPDVVITDPPRAGMHENVIKNLLQMAPAKIVYVSCNPATQARDIALMKDAYNLVKMQAVDMFPNTHHVENVALLVRKQRA